MRQIIKLKRLKKEPTLGGDVLFRIVFQSHRYNSFANGKCFKASNGVQIYSSCNPEWAEVDGTDTLYVWGRYKSADHNVFVVAKRDYAKIKKAVAEFNATDF